MNVRYITKLSTRELQGIGHAVGILRTAESLQIYTTALCLLHAESRNYLKQRLHFRRPETTIAKATTDFSGSSEGDRKSGRSFSLLSEIELLSIAPRASMGTYCILYILRPLGMRSWPVPGGLRTRAATAYSYIHRLTYAPMYAAHLLPPGAAAPAAIPSIRARRSRVRI